MYRSLYTCIACIGRYTRVLLYTVYNTLYTKSDEQVRNYAHNAHPIERALLENETRSHAQP